LTAISGIAVIIAVLHVSSYVQKRSDEPCSIVFYRRLAYPATTRAGMEGLKEDAFRFWERDVLQKTIPSLESSNQDESLAVKNITSTQQAAHTGRSRWQSQ
jgi:hypothetical protein